MSVLPLCLEPHPVLRAHARPVHTFSRELRQLAEDLIDTMYANDGIGLAAPQVGREVQLFVANPTQRRGEELVVVNPTLEQVSGRATMVEGCLSLPKVWEKVKRSARIRLAGQDVAGKPLKVEAEGLLAIILQHEWDHLQGQLFIDRLSWFRRRRAMARFRTIMRASASPRR